MAIDDGDTPTMVVAKALKRLYPQNPDIVLGREARTIVAYLESSGHRLVPESFVEAVRYSGSFDIKRLQSLWDEAEFILDGPAQPPTSACPYCDDTGWVEDKNWQPEYRGQVRVARSGLIPCGALPHHIGPSSDTPENTPQGQ